MRFARMIGRYDAETTAYTECAGTGGTSPYTPDFSGRLIGLMGICGGGAATTLINCVQFKITCNSFKPNAIEAFVLGNGLETVPTIKPAPITISCDQPIVAGVPITVEGRHLDADTPVTCDVQLIGIFEV